MLPKSSSQTPAITTFTLLNDNHKQGDVLISLPDNLIVRMEEYIRKNTECPDKAVFNNPSPKRADDFGAVLCGAESIIINAVPGGTFAGLRPMNARPLPFTAGDAIRAMNAAALFALSLAPLLQLDAQMAESLGYGAFAIAYGVLIEGKPLSSENVIPAEALAGTFTSAASTTTSSASTCSSCFADCTFIGAIQMCGTVCSEQSSCATSSGSGSISTTARLPFVVPSPTVVP